MGFRVLIFHTSTNMVELRGYFTRNSMSVLSWNAGGLKSDKSKLTLLPAAMHIVTKIQLVEGGETLIFRIQTCALSGFLTVNIQLLSPRKHIAPLLKRSICWT
jgi:hypothetical protein